MGTDQCTRPTLLARCCHGAFFGFGFVSTILTLTVMFWIAWCYFGLTILQISDTQRRALVNYSYVSAKPLPTPTTAVPSGRPTIGPAEESSINSISKSSTTASILRGLSRGESQVKVDKKKEAAVITNLAKGDFAGRDREVQKNATINETDPLPKDITVISPEREATSKKRDVPYSSAGATAAILSGAETDESDERVYARRVLPSGTENRAEEKSDSSDRSIRRNPDLQSASHPDIQPTKVYATASASGSLKVENPADRPAREEGKTRPRDYIDREKPREDDVQTSPRSDVEEVYREPDFDKEYTKRYPTSSNRGRYDVDFDDERGTRGRYDKRERGREGDDRYSKGDTRVYPDDKVLAKNPSTDEERYRLRERYPDDISRRGDDDTYDDRYRVYDEKSRIRDKDETIPRDKDLDRPLSVDGRYKDDERYRSRDDDRYSDREDRYRSRDDDRYRLRDDRPVDDRYKSRDDDRYRSRDDDRYRPRDDERYKPRDDDRYKPRDDDRYIPRNDERYRIRDDESYRSRDIDRYSSRGDERYKSRDDDRYRYRDDEKYRSRGDDKYSIDDEDKYRARDDDRYRSDLDDRRTLPSRSTVEEDRYRSRSDDDKYIDTSTSRNRDADIRESVSRSSSLLPIGDRKPSNSRPQYDKSEEPLADSDISARDRPSLRTRDDINPPRISRPRPLYDEDRYKDRDGDDRYRSTRYDEDDVKTISPSRTKTDSTFSRSTLIDSKLKNVDDDPKYVDNPRTRNDQVYDEDERNPSIRLQDSRSTILKTENSRRYMDENERYRTKLPNEKSESSLTNDKREDVVLDRRSYASEEDEDYRRGVSRTRGYYEDRPRSPTENTRRYRDDESYARRDTVLDEEFRRDRQRDSDSRDRRKNRDRYDDKYISRDEDRYPLREDLVSSPARKYDTYPDDDERTRRRDSEIRTIRNRDETIRPSASSRNEERFYDREDIPEIKSSSRTRYDDYLPVSDEDDVRDRDAGTRRYSSGSKRSTISREPVLGSSMSVMSSRDPSDVVIREKRFQSSNDNRYQSSRVISNERSYMDSESESKEQVRPLSAKDVIEAAIRHSDNSDQNSRKVHYPVFDPRISNLTSPEIIRPSERRGTLITARKRRSA